MDSSPPTPTIPLPSPSKPTNNNNDPAMATNPIPNLNPSPSPKRKKSPRNPKPKSQSHQSTAQAANPRRKGKRRLLEEEEIVLERPRKRRQKIKRQIKTKVLDGEGGENALCLVAPYPERYGDDGSGCGEANVWDVISELVMWKNVAKSTLWFGSGSIFFLSSCFSMDSNFSIISAASYLGILILGIAFIHDSLPRQRQKPREARFQLTEEDCLRAARLILPMTNAVLAKYQDIFSGEPLMTLKVAPILLFAAKYGHLITPWRLLVNGFFLSFTLPKLFSSYGEKIHQRVEEAKSYVKETWKSCPRKKFVAVSTAMLCWNMFSVKTRVVAAFMSVAILRHNKQQRTGVVSNEIDTGAEQQQVMFLEQ